MPLVEIITPCHLVNILQMYILRWHGIWLFYSCWRLWFILFGGFISDLNRAPIAFNHHLCAQTKNEWNAEMKTGGKWLHIHFLLNFWKSVVFDWQNMKPLNFRCIFRVSFYRHCICCLTCSSHIPDREYLLNAYSAKCSL